ncbi:MAG: DMT family transporter [Desulfobacula sp.]|nr:DMT family transporter [Desulfobacteraceae bacterium]MBT3806891.1 DMT family transporter [Desulfobacula sp.]MBT4027218.1 DMT family transporter [Desulfobacula sp.]MBT4201000.1 DMT family transporter [Desulfobacula sp.]MBT4876901.1 DMT family transporter [Desulfobacula sp.]
MKNEYAFGLLTVLFWSTSATAFKITLQYLDVLQLLLYSIITAVVILGAHLLINKKFHTVFKLKTKEYVFYLILGFLNPFVYYWMAIKAYDLLPAQIVQPINYTWVITLSLLSIPLLKQTFSKMQILATLVCYTGVVVLSYRKGATTGFEISYFGVFLAISCTIIWALYWIYNVRSNQDPIVAIFLNFLFSIPFVAIACSVFSSFEVTDLKGIYGVVWIGCFEFGFAFITWITALRSAKNTNHVTNLIFLTPFISLIFIHTILGEQIQLQTYAGLVLIIIGIVIQKYNELKI